MNANVIAQRPVAGSSSTPLSALPKKVGQKLKRKLAGPLQLNYPGQAENGPYFAEVYLTWYFGRGTVMWRARFDSEESAKLAGKEHAQYLDSVLPTHYRAENWSGRPYMERHEYGISWCFGESCSRSADELASVSRTALPGCEPTN